MNERWHYDRKYSNCYSNGDAEQFWQVSYLTDSFAGILKGDTDLKAL